MNHCGGIFGRLSSSVSIHWSTDRTIRCGGTFNKNYGRRVYFCGPRHQTKNILRGSSFIIRNMSFGLDFIIPMLCSTLLLSKSAPLWALPWRLAIFKAYINGWSAWYLSHLISTHWFSSLSIIIGSVRLTQGTSWIIFIANNIPGKNWLVEMPMTAGHYKQTISSFWISSDGRHPREPGDQWGYRLCPSQQSSPHHKSVRYALFAARYSWQLKLFSIMRLVRTWPSHPLWTLFRFFFCCYGSRRQHTSTIHHHSWGIVSSVHGVERRLGQGGRGSQIGDVSGHRGLLRPSDTDRAMDWARRHLFKWKSDVTYQVVGEHTALDARSCRWHSSSRKLSPICTSKRMICAPS